MTRFVGAVTAKPLSPRHQEDVNLVLAPAEAELFFRQQAGDQRHAYVVAQRVSRQLPGDRDVLAAALLHDVGKLHSNLGPVQRSLATVLDVCGLPMPESWSAYRDHGALGALDLEQVGAPPLAIAFAAGTGPEDESVRQALIEADNGPGWDQPTADTLAQARDSGGWRNTMPPEVNR